MSGPDIDWIRRENRVYLARNGSEKVKALSIAAGTVCEPEGNYCHRSVKTSEV